MGDELKVDLTLDEKVSGPAKKAADALAKVEAQANKAQSVLNNKFAASWEKIGFASARAASKQEKAFAASWSKIGMAAEKAQQRAHRAAEKAKEGGWLGKGQEELTKKLIGGFAALELAGALVEGATKAVEIITEGVKLAFEAGGKQEKLRLSYRLLLGQGGGKEAMEDQERFSKKTRFTGSEVGRLMIPIYNAGLSGKAARQTFATASDLDAKFGGGIENFVEMLTKISLKGGVTEKMLVSIGVRVQDFYESLGKATGVTKEVAKKRAGEGKVDPQLLLNLVTQGVNAKQGGAAGTGGQLASETMEARLHKLTSLPEVYLEKMSESPAWTKLSDRLGELLTQLDPDSPRGKKIMDSLFSIFNKLTDVAQEFLSPAGIDAFVGGLQRILSLVESIFNVMQGVANTYVSAAAHVSTLTGSATDNQKTLLQQQALFSKAAEFGTHPEMQTDKQYAFAAKQVGVSPDVLRQASQTFGQGGKGKAEALEKFISRTVTNSPTINIHLNGDGKDDIAKAQAAGQAAGEAMNSVMQRAAQEGGG